MTRLQPFPVLLPVYDASLAAAGPEVVLPRFAAGGARWVEYRDKGATDREFLAGAARAARAADAHGLRLLINDRLDVALAVGAGVHLGQEDLPTEVARRLLGPEAIIGLSCDRLDDVAAANTLPVDYVAVGPVYATRSKADAGSPVGLDTVVAARALSRHPLVAIGGIGVESAAEVTAAGADCVAVLSALLGAPDIALAAARLREAASRGKAVDS